MTGEVIEIEQDSRQDVFSVVDLNTDHFVNNASELRTESESQLPKKDASKSEDVNKDDLDKVDLSCGIGSLRTNVFGSKFANLYSFAVCFGLANLFAAMVSQVVQVQLTSLERQFNIDNVRAGLFETVSRIGYISTLLLAGHFAKQYNMPMIIGVSGVFQGLVLTIPAIMQFVDPYKLPVLSEDSANNSQENKNDSDSHLYMCTSVEQNNTIEDIGEVKQLQFIVVLIVQTIKGLTDTFHNGVLPILYMDDNMVKKSQMGIMLGIWQILAELSGPIGKQINGILSEVPIDLIATKMDPKDRRFVSAWWLAFLVFGLGTAVFSFPIMLFPRSLVSERQKRDALRQAVVTFAGGEIADEVVETVEQGDKEAEAPREHEPTTITELNANEMPDSHGRKYSVSTIHSRSNSRKNSGRRGSRINDLSRRRSSLFPPVVGPTERKVSITGDLIFDQPIKRQDSLKEESLADLIKDFPKALVRVFKKPVFVLSLIDIAIVSVPYSGTAIFRNTYMVNEYNVTMSEVAYITGISTAVGMITGTIVSSWVSSKVNTKIGYALISSTTWVVTLIIIPFFFVLSCDNQVVYGSTGEFGREANLTDCNCTLKHQLISCGDDGANYISPCYAGCSDVASKFFTNCTLVNATLGTRVTPGLCQTDCHVNFVIYCVLQGALTFVWSVSMIPRRLMVLRIVDPQDRGFATSLFNFSFVLIGIPSSNLFGGIIDGTCLIWDDNLCTLYDRDKIRYLMSGIDISVHACVQITFLLMIVIFKWEERKATREEKDLSKATEVEANAPTIQ